MYSISIVIPARNEAECLPATIREWQQQKEVSEILVVDGYSTDASAAVAAKAGAKVVLQSGGAGYGLGVMSGVACAQGELLSFIDADGSYDPISFSQMCRLIEEGNDVVFCSRYLPMAGSDDDTWIRFIGNKLFTAIVRIFFGVKLTDSLFFYALIRKEVFNKISLHSTGFEWCLEFAIRVHQAGLRYAELPSRERPRIAGESKVNALGDGMRMLKLLLREKFCA